ncbi:nuclear transport factor 2 family protein [Chloroflexota bacterium]
MEESLWCSKTRFNREYMEKVLSREFLEFGGSGRIYKREDTLSAPAQEIRAKLPLKDFTAHFVSENVILVTYVSEVEYDTIQISNRGSLWVKTLAGWQLRFHQETPRPGSN